MWRSRPSAMFSATVREEKIRASWNERPRPNAARLSGDQSVTSWPRSSTRPSSSFRKPETSSKIVVLPAPFGPMRPRISPGIRSKLTSLVAVMPPKRFTRFRTSSTGCPASTPAFSVTARASASAEPPCPNWAEAFFGLSSPPVPSRNTERRMSPRSSSSSVLPSKRTSPFSMKNARVAIVSATLIDCSTRMIVVPWAWISRTMRRSCSTMVGARPSDSSSMISSRGRATKAMPTASCWASPPERLPASCFQRSRRRGNSSRTRWVRSSITFGSSFLSKRNVPHWKCSSTVSVGKIALPPGTTMMPIFEVVTASAMVMSWPSKVMVPAHGRSQAGDRLEDRRLAGAVGAQQGDDLAFVDLHVDAEQDLDAAVLEVDALAGQQRCVGGHDGASAWSVTSCSTRRCSWSRALGDGQHLAAHGTLQGALLVEVLGRLLGVGDDVVLGSAALAGLLDPHVGHQRGHDDVVLGRQVAQVPVAEAEEPLGQAAGQQVQDQEQAGAGDEQRQTVEEVLAEQVDALDDEDPGGGAAERREAADDRGDEHVDRVDDAVHRGVDAAQLVEEQPAGHAR